MFQAKALRPARGLRVFVDCLFDGVIHWNFSKWVDASLAGPKSPLPKVSIHTRVVDAKIGHLGIVDGKVSGVVQSVVAEASWDHSPAGGKMKQKISYKTSGVFQNPAHTQSENIN